ncbi:NAD-dependent epimerase/dehydratase family protein [Patescibacteria group bacterium]|nr:NAD-dependent epimerase/dehydratase family protein [Patescibacteria group bacterium]MBU1896123.1 NAD-dependent epimerase/dehydratase family protein [Patescibacteria group bacterium]
MAIYLVTGGAGFIGTNLVKKLLAEGHEVRVIDNYAGGKKEDRFQAGAEYVEGDIRNREDLDKVMVGMEGVFHMAALPRVIYSVEHPEETHDVNVNGTLNVLLSARDNGVKRVVFSSSSSASGDQPREAYPLKEDGFEKKPLAPYALHKLIGEHYFRLFAELYNLETVSLVYFNVYGPYCDPNGAYALVIGKFLEQRKNGEPMTIRGDGEMYRDYTHVDDVVNANILAMTKDTVGKGELINVGFGHPYSVNELADMIGGPTVNVDALPGEMKYTEADNTKAKELLGWEPTINLEDGIKELKKEWGVE